MCEFRYLHNTIKLDNILISPLKSLKLFFMPDINTGILLLYLNFQKGEEFIAYALNCEGKMTLFFYGVSK